MKTWIRVARSDDVIKGGGSCVKLVGVQVARFRVPDGERHPWYTVQNLCPNDRRRVLSRGLTGDAKGEPKVACPLHKNTFSLLTGEHLAGASSKAAWRLETFPVKEEGGFVFLDLGTSRLTPPPEPLCEPGQADGHGRAS